MPKLSRRQSIQLFVSAPIILAGPVSAAATPIAEAKFVPIGGIDQWVAVQGRDASNPAILFLHGGPGQAQSPFLKQFLPWEQDFTVVNWDQRGAGKTFGRSGSITPALTLDRMVDDAIEVADFIRGHLSQSKIILIGHSWGSFLGLHVIKRRPELFHAFVGTGQFVSIADSLPDRIQWTRQKATAEGDQETLQALDAALALPPDRRNLALAQATNKWAQTASDVELGSSILEFAGIKPPRPVTGDAADWKAGNAFSGSSPDLIQSVITADPRKLNDIPIPFFVIQGRDDHTTPFAAAKGYVEVVRAPAKAFVPIDGGHYACFTNADQFAAALRQYVRPLAI